MSDAPVEERPRRTPDRGLAAARLQQAACVLHVAFDGDYPRRPYVASGPFIAFDASGFHRKLSSFMGFIHTSLSGDRFFRLNYTGVPAYLI
jgi:hypothetical protein